MEINKAFSYPVEDRQWATKLGLAILFWLVPILNLVWLGYQVEVIRRVRDGHSEPLPDWSDLGLYFKNGLVLFLTKLIYGLPFLVLGGLPILGFLIAAFLKSNDLYEVSQVVNTLSIVLLVCMGLFLLVYGVLLAMVQPAVTVQYARYGTFGSCFQIRTIVQYILRYPAPYLTAWAVSIAAGVGAAFVVLTVAMAIGWVPCLGQLAALLLQIAAPIYVGLIYAHLFGQFSRMVLVEAMSAESPRLDQSDTSGQEGNLGLPFK